VVNQQITELLDTAIAGTTTLSTDADVTLTTTSLAANQARQAVLLWTANGTVTRNITAPAQSKAYVVINNSAGTQSIVVRGAGPTTGVTIIKGERALVAWNGSDFVKVGSTSGAGTFTDLTVTGNTTLGDATTDTVTINATVQPGVVISGSSASAALRVTQTGAGNALLVEDSANPDANPFVIDQNGVVVSGNTAPISAFTSPRIQAQVTDATSSFSSIRFSADAGSVRTVYAKSRGALGVNTAVLSGDEIGSLDFAAADGTSYVAAARIFAAVDGTPGTNDMPGRLIFSTTADGASTATEWMRIGSTGAIGFNSSITLGGASGRFRFGGNITGAVSSAGVVYTPTIQSDVTTTGALFQTTPATQDAAFTLTNLHHYVAAQGTVTGGSRIAPTNQIGFYATTSLTGATNNYGFRSDIAAATGRWNFYAAGTAANYFAGQVQLADGSAAAPALSNFGDENTGIYFPAADTIAFVEGGTEAMRITSTGDVGIGTSTPAVKLDVDGAFYCSSTTYLASKVSTGDAAVEIGNDRTGSGVAYIDLHSVVGTDYDGRIIRGSGANGAFQFLNTGLGDFKLQQTGAGAITFDTSNIERMRIDSSGNVGVGTSLPATLFNIYSNSAAANLRVSGDSVNTSIGAFRYETNANASTIVFGKFRGSVASPTAVASGDTSGTLIYNAYGGTNSRAIAGISGIVGTYTSDTNITGYLSFLTNTGSTTTSEKMRIDSAGNAQALAGAFMPWAPAPASIATTATLTNADIQAQIINTTGTSYTVTMPLGTTLEALSTWAAANIGYDFTVINTASGTITMAVNTGVTSLGGLTIATGVSAQFRIRRTAANTFVLYRLS
jgi:hypothetical protein